LATIKFALKMGISKSPATSGRSMAFIRAKERGRIFCWGMAA